MNRRNFLKGGLAAACILGCNAGTPTSPEPVYSPIPYVPDYDVIAGAGDIGCGPGADLTAGVLRELKIREPHTRIFTLGDNTQDRGSPEEYACFDRTWGQPKVDYPVYGNHDSVYFFTYFKDNATGGGYYSRQLRYWHLVFLNSEIDIARDSVQLAWLDYDLRHREKRWIAAFDHRPRFTSGNQNGEAKNLSDAWDILDSHGAKLMLSGHNHQYEIFAPQDSGGREKPGGMVQIVAGTGGASQNGYIFAGEPRKTSLVRESGTMGILALYLKPNGYDREFMAVPGSSFTDRASVVLE